VTTIQGPQQGTTTQEPLTWYPIPLQLRYKATSKLGPLEGFGQTKMMSSKDIIFGPGDGLQPGMGAEIVVAWPRLLDGRIRLLLVLEVAITCTQNGVAQGRILRYDFRTRRPAEAEQITEPSGAEGPSRAGNRV
jgi:hypothetical protein